MELTVGSRWRSAVDDTEVVVVKPPTSPVDLECGGQPMVAVSTPSPGLSPAPGLQDGTQLGKRYVDDDVGIEVLCTKAGEGSLAVSGRTLALKEAKPLPSSD